MTVMRPLPERDQSAPARRRWHEPKRPGTPRRMPKPAPQKPRILPERQDREFLAAGLAIIESPPSPIKIGLMLTICAFATGALA